MKRGANDSRRRAFTLVELLIAMALSLIVLSALFATLMMSSNAARVTDEQINERVEARLTQMALQRTARSLVGGIPATTPPSDEEDSPDSGGMEESGGSGGSSSPTDGAAGAISSAVGRIEGQVSDEVFTAAQAVLGGGSGGAGGGLETDNSGSGAAPMAILSSQIDPYSEPDYFILEYEELGDGRYVQRLVVMLRESPLPLTAQELEARTSENGRVSVTPTDAVYGAFELRETVEDGWVLQWAPIEPAGEPQILVRRITRCEWSVLPSGIETDEWPDQYSAYLAEDFPFVFRLVLETESGVYEDWVFETNVVTRGT